MVSRSDRIWRGVRAWVPVALPVAMVWLLYQNFAAFQLYQASNNFHYQMIVHHAKETAGWRPQLWKSSRQDYYWLQDALRGTTLVMPPDLKINLSLWRHLALVNPVLGEHGRINSSLARQLAKDAEVVTFFGTTPWYPGQPRMLKGQIYFPESSKSIKGTRAYWVVEQVIPPKRREPRHFVLSQTLFERVKTLSERDEASR